MAATGFRNQASGTLTINGGITVDYSGGNLQFFPNVNTGTVAFSVNAAGDINVTSGTLSFGLTGGFALAGLAQTNTSTTTVGGTLNLNLSNNATATLGHIAMSGGTFTLNLGSSTAGGTTVSSLAGSSGTVSGGTGSNATTTLTINSTTNTTYSGVLTNGSSSNVLTLVKTGTGTQVLSGTLGYTGATSISNGVLELGGSATANNSAVNVDAGATLRFDNSANVTRTNTISGGGALVKAGSSTVTLTANNSYTGTTTVSGGRLLVNGTNTSSAVIVQAPGALGGSGQVGDLTVSGLLAPGSSTGTLSAGNTVFDTGGAFELEMFNWTGTAGTGWDLLAVTGDLTLSNTALNPFTINLVSLSSTNTPGLSTNFDPAQSFTNTFVTYTGSLLGNAFAADLFTVNTSAFSNTFTGTFSLTNLAGGLALLYQAAAGPIAYDWATGSGLWSVGANWSDNEAPTNGASVSFSGAGGASTNNAVVSSITGLIFSNGAGSYTISGDSLTVGSNGIVNNSATVQTVVNDITLGDSLEVSAASGAIVLGGATALAGNNLTYAATQGITNSGAISGSGQIIKTGGGDLVLAGANTYDGLTSVNAGSLFTVSAGSLGATNAGTVVASGARLVLFATNSGFTVGNEALTIAGNGTGSGALLNSGGDNTYQGTISLSAAATIGASVGTSLTLDVASGNAIEASNLNLTFSGAGTNRVNDAINLGTGALNKTGTGVTILSAGNSYSGGTLISEGTMGMGHDNAFGTGTVTNGTGAIFSTDASARSLTNEFVMGGSSALAGTGSLTLSNLTVATSTGIGNLTNNIAGGLVVNGTVTLGSGTQNRSLVLLGTGNTTFNGSIVPSASGTGSIIAETTGGVVTLNASNSYNGNTIVRSNSVLRIGNAYALGTTDGFTQINGGAQLDLNGQSVAGEELRLNNGDVLDVPRLVNSSSSVVTWSGTVNMGNTNAIAVTNGAINFTGNMTGSGAMTKTGSGTLLFTGTSDRTGATTVAAGTLVVGDGATGGSLGSGAVKISEGSAATLRFNRSDTVTLSAVISGNAAGSLVQAGAGTLTLAGANTFAGNIDVQAGTVQLDTTAGSAAGAVSAISVAGGATLLLSRSNQVSDTASVTLSGGTITRGSGVSEVFGDLNLTGNSTLDFGVGTAGNLTFGIYEGNATPGAMLTLNNFFGGNTLVFGSDLSSYLAPGTYNTNNFSNSYFTINSISGGFTASVQDSTFTITAIPEPSTVLTASALACLLLGGMLRRGKTRRA